MWAKPNTESDIKLFLPTATISSNITSVCQGATSPIITFTGNGGTAPYTFTYTINGNSQPTITTTSGNSVTLNLTTASSGVFTYSLVSVKDSTNTTQNQNGTVTVTVNSLPNIDFTYNGDNSCSPVNFTATPTSGPYTYTWNFNDNSPITLPQANNQISHLFNAFGNSGSQTFNVSLTVTNTITNCTSSVTKPITVLKRPESALNISTTNGATFYDVAQQLFVNCDATLANPNFTFVAVNASSTQSSNTNYEINWGDNSTPESFTSNFTSAPHTYTSLGIFNITVTTSNNSGCSSSITYTFFNGNSPAGNLGSIGNTNSCAPFSITWPVQNITNNPPGTTYDIYVSNDSSIPHQYYTQANIPSSITINFNESSCGLTNNEFVITFQVTNPCGQSSPTLPVKLSQKPEASFNISSQFICVNNTTTFTNTSQGNYFSGTNCLNNFNKTWTITPNTGWNLTSGNLNGTDVIGVNFTNSGQFVVSLSIIKPGATIADCTYDTISYTICVHSPPSIPTFNLNSSSPQCVPYTLNPTIDSPTLGICDEVPNYEWQITYVNGNCGTTSSYNYINNTSSTSIAPNINFSEAGTYTIILKAINDCGFTTSIPKTIIITKPPIVNISPINNYCGTLPYNINPQVTVCKPDPYPINTIEYIWSVTPSTGVTIPSPNSEDPGTISFSIAGTYTVTLSINNHICGNSSASQTFTITNPPALSLPIAQQICSGQTVSINISNPDNATITWIASSTTITGFDATTNSANLNISSPNQAIITQTLFNNGSTSDTVTYTIIATLNGCSTTQTYVITVDPLPTITQPAPITTCINGTATLSVNAITNANYQWYSNTTNSNSGGSIITGATSVIFTTALFTTPGIFYFYCEISNLASSSSACNSITTNAVAVTVEPIPTLTIQPSTSQTVCVGQAISPLEVISSGTILPSGTPTYQWYSNTTNSNTNGSAISGENSATYSIATPFSTAGTYYYYVTVDYSNSLCSNAGLLTSAVFEINVVDAPTITSLPFTPQILCQGLGVPTQLEILPIGLQYEWFSNISNSISGGTSLGPPSATNTFMPPTPTALGSTYYYCIISNNAAGCFTASSVAEITLVAGTSINPTVNLTQISCYNSPPQNNGAISIVSTIPVGYTINWTDLGSFNSSASTISNLAPGNYQLTITDPNGCPFIQTYTILPQPSEIIITPTAINNVSCLGGNNGSIDITIIGGTASTGNYSYEWSLNGVSQPQYLNQQDISNLTAGIYLVTVKDDNGCQKSETFTITEPTTSITLPVLSSVTNVTCNGEATGAITINSPLGGTPGYNYNWTGPNNYQSNAQNLQGLIAGTYNLEVTDSLGCSPNLGTDLTVVISEPLPISITYTTTPVICDGDNNGSITITNISGGVPPYTNTFNGITTTSLFFPNLAPGNYTFAVTDTSSAQGCQQLFSIPIAAPPAFNINPVVTNISCNGANNGSIALNPNIATPPITVSWTFTPLGSTTPITFNNFALTLNNLAPGTYTVTIDDGTTCPVINQSFTINEPFPLTASISATDALDCFNPNSGSINLIVSGGTQPYTYNGSLSLPNTTNIPPGNYSIVVDDANHCGPITVSYTIGRPREVTVSATSTLNMNCEPPSPIVSRSFVAQASGGIPPYQYIWSSGVVSGPYNQFMTTNQNGLVTLNAFDSRGCPALQLFTEDITDIFSIGDFSIAAAVSIGSTSYGGYAINDPIEFTSTITGDSSSVSWDFGDGSPPVSSLANQVVQHTYLNVGQYNVILTVTYGEVCTYQTSPYPVTIGLGYLLVVPTAFTPEIKDNYNDTFRPVAKYLTNLQMDIYDTWGHLIYSETGDDLVGWDGKIKGYEAENGNYNCKVSGETFYGKKIDEERTFVLSK